MTSLEPKVSKKLLVFFTEDELDELISAFKSYRAVISDSHQRNQNIVEIRALGRSMEDLDTLIINIQGQIIQNKSARDHEISSDQ